MVMVMVMVLVKVIIKVIVKVMVMFKIMVIVKVMVKIMVMVLVRNQVNGQRSQHCLEGDVGALITIERQSSVCVKCLYYIWNIMNRIRLLYCFTSCNVLKKLKPVKLAAETCQTGS